MTTYKGFPGPHICDFWTREESAANYDDGSTFQIGRIDMVANTGTYLDAPFHRYEDGSRSCRARAGALADLPGIVVRQPVGERPDGRHGAVRGPRRSRQSGAGSHRLGPPLGDRRLFRRSSLSDRATRRDCLVEPRRRAGRDRQPQYRRHARPSAARALHLARRRHPDLRAYDRARQPARRGFPFFGRAAKGRGMGTFPVRAYAVLGR